MHRTLRRRRTLSIVSTVASLVASLACTSCASSSAMRAAERGDWKNLGQTIGRDHARGSLTNEDASEIARVVVRRELEHGPKAEAVDRVRELRGCASEVDGELSSRMGIHDDAGAEAAMARLDAGNLGKGRARDFLTEPNEAWRAVGARGLVRSKDSEARVKALLDGSPRVRRAAARAAAEAGADEEEAPVAELTQLATTARVDSEGIVRTEAVRALAAIGGAPVVAIFRDLETTGDDGVRQDVAVAWAAKRVHPFGGEEPLRLLLAAGHGPGAIEAAAAVLRSPHVDAPDLRASAAASMARAISRGPRRDRLHAILMANPSEPLVLDALRQAGAFDVGGDREIEIAANGRLAEIRRNEAVRATAIRSLEIRAGQELGPLSARARSALASAGDARIQAWVEKDLEAAQPHVRLSAASALADLGRPARAAPLLADLDPSVRTRAACRLLVSTRQEASRVRR